jgi:hypothetical protein
MLKRMMWKIAYADTTAVETITAVQSMLLGIWLLLPFDSFGSSQAFRIMSVIAPEWAWSVLMVAIGVSQLYFVHTKRITPRLNMARVMLPVWIVIDLSFLLSLPASTASSTYFVFVLCCVWSVISLVLRKNRGCH